MSFDSGEKLSEQEQVKEQANGPEFEPIAKLLRELVDLAMQMQERLSVLITVHRQAHWLRSWERTASEMEWIFRAVAEGLEREDTRASSVVMPLKRDREG